MKQLFIPFLVILSLITTTFAQSPGQATGIISGPTNPATCDPTKGSLFYNTTSKLLEHCGVNGWTRDGVSVGSFYASDFGAKGDGSTDDTASIQAAMNACKNSGRPGTVYIPATPNGYVLTRGTTSGRLGAANQQGGINGYPGCSLLGNNTKLILRGNSAFIFYDPEIVATLTTATITADTVAGQTNFTVNSSAGFVIGDDVYFRLGADTTNPPEASYFGFAKISAIPNGTQLTLDRPLNQAMTVASTLAYDRQIFKSSLGFVQNIEIGGFQFVTDHANGGSAEYGVYCAHCRNVHIHDIQATDPGAGAVYTQFVDDVSVDNVGVLSSFAFGAASKGIGAEVTEATNVTLTNLRVSKFDTRVFTCEAFSKNIYIKNLQSINNTTVAQSGVIEIAVGQGCEVHVDGWRIEGLASQALFDNQNNTQTGNIWAGNVNLNVTGMATMEPGNLLANMWGKFVWTNGNANVSTMYGTYSAPRQWSGQLPLTASSANTLNLPDGIYKKFRVYASSTTGITSTFAVSPGSHNSGDITSSLSSGNTVDLVNAAITGISAAVGSQNTWGLTGKQLVVNTGAGVAAGTYLTVWIEYYPLDGASPSRIAAQQDSSNVISP
jgi:hypothetical protein